MREPTSSGVESAARFITASRRLRLQEAPRYALYYAPPPGDPWWEFGSAWLGRDAVTGRACAAPAAVDLDPGYVRSVTSEPRRYGFHATLKAPFRLAPGYHAADLRLQAALFVQERPPLALPPLELTVIDGFVALTPSRPCAVRALADACVAAFDNLRAPPTRAELARRQLDHLTGRESELLAQWGYPYVFDEYRFHFTLTNRLSKIDRERVLEALAAPVDALGRHTLKIDALSLFAQQSPAAPFVVARRYDFAGGQRG